MTYSRTVPLLIVVTLVLLFTGSAFGQIIYGQPTSGNLGVVYTHWKSTDDSTGLETTLNQFAIPFTAFIPLQDNFDMTVFAANASNSMDFGDGDLKLNGLSDVSLQANHSFAEDQLILSAGVNLPTGKKKLDFSEEWLVLQGLSQNYLDFPVQRLGEGFGFNLLLGGATVLGEGIRGGAGVMYQYVGTYEPYEGIGDYNPGDVISFNAGVDIERGQMTWSVDAVLTSYSTDELDGEKTLKQSSQFDTRFAVRRVDEKMSWGGMIRYVMRGENKDYVNETLLGPSEFKIYGDEFSANANVVWTFSNDMYFRPAVDIRLIGANDMDFESSTILGFGTGLGKRVGDNMNLDAGFKLYTGSADGGDIDLSGYQFTLGLTATM